MGKHKIIKLSGQAKFELSNQLKDNRRSLKIAVVLLLDTDMSQVDIANAFSIHPDTVAEIKREYDRDDDKWADGNYKGSKSKLNPDQKVWLSTHLEAQEIITPTQIQELIKEQFSISYCLSSIYNLLEELNFIYDYPIPVLRGDPKEQEKWVKQFNKLENKLEDNQVILFSDGVHPTHNTQYTRMWMKKDKPKKLPTNSGRQRINVQGSYDVGNQTGVFTQHETINAESIIEHYEELLKKYPDKKTIYLVQDNARYYFGKADKWLKNHNRKHNTTKIRIIKLPTYSPNLNKIEKLWLFMKQEIIHNKYYSKFKDFKNAIDDFTENIDRYQLRLETFITLKFHIPEV